MLTEEAQGPALALGAQHPGHGPWVGWRPSWAEREGGPGSGGPGRPDQREAGSICSACEISWLH